MFRNTIAFNERPTGDDVVRVDVVDSTHPYLKGVMEQGDDPIWWLEASSYPIRVIDHDRVKVLVTSRELKKKHGEAPVAVNFPVGKGEVFHMISHYYLQRTELRTDRHRAPASAYAASMGVKCGGDLEDLSTGDVESARTSSRMLSNLIAQKKRRNDKP